MARGEQRACPGAVGKKWGACACVWLARPVNELVFLLMIPDVTHRPTVTSSSCSARMTTGAEGMNTVRVGERMRVVSCGFGPFFFFVDLVVVLYDRQ